MGCSGLHSVHSPAQQPRLRSSEVRQTSVIRSRRPFFDASPPPFRPLDTRPPAPALSAWLWCGVCGHKGVHKSVPFGWWATERSTEQECAVRMGKAYPNRDKLPSGGRRVPLCKDKASLLTAAIQCKGARCRPSVRKMCGDGRRKEGAVRPCVVTTLLPQPWQSCCESPNSFIGYTARPIYTHSGGGRDSSCSVRLLFFVPPFSCFMVSAFLRHPGLLIQNIGGCMLYDHLILMCRASSSHRPHSQFLNRNTARMKKIAPSTMSQKMKKPCGERSNGRYSKFLV